MATSSIRKTFVIEGEEMAKKFADAIDWSMKHREPIKSDVTVQELSDEEFIKFCKRKRLRELGHE